MRTGWDVTQIHFAQRVLENLAIVAHQRSRSFVPKDGPMPKAVEAVQANVLQIGAIQFENRAKRKKVPLRILFCPYVTGLARPSTFSWAAAASSPRPAMHLQQAGEEISGAALDWLLALSTPSHPRVSPVWLYASTRDLRAVGRVPSHIEPIHFWPLGSLSSLPQSY